MTDARGGRSGVANGMSRRTALAAGLVCLATPGHAAVKAPRLCSPVALSADDIAWFRACRSEWVDGENGAPAIFGHGIMPDTIGNASPAEREAYENRLEPILCAFFLHATFGPGRYRFAAPFDGMEEIDVTSDDVTIMRRANWRTFAIDNKRPYGDFTNYPIDMARALGIPIGKDPVEGHATIPEAEDARMVTLHLKSQFVLQAFIEHAAVAPDRWFVPADGWGGIVFPRCRPVTAAAIDAYEKAIGIARAMPDASRIRFKAQEALFLSA